ncbi:MAG: UDP-N-acetylmuramate--L-alanine ligase [Clostridia bacterium]|nr:UDP-N-acetylmuramate--L-alanine ligase [Clostridia bacterium]
MSNILDTVRKIHFVGIGGSGMCPIAEILYTNGYHITGSDRSEGETLNRIKNMGIPVMLGHSEDNVDGADLVVYTAAVKQDNPELVGARKKGIPAIERSVMLGELARKYENAVGISGTHGKTTTTGMLTQVLMTAEMDPSAVIGGKLNLIGGNGRAGKSETIVCEACEYVDTFLQMTPAMSVILNVDADHLDYFGTLENIIKSFNKFAQQTSRTVVINGDDENSRKAVEGIDPAKVVTFGLADTNDYYAVGLATAQRACYGFALYHKGEKLCDITLSVPGTHNVMNALAAAAAAHQLGAAPAAIAAGLHDFVGVHRRFEIRGQFDGVTVADDFAHHPAELSSTLRTAMKMGYNKVWAIFQPHTYSRTHLLFNDFVEALSIPDQLILTEILAVREENTYNIYADDLAAKIPGTVRLNTFDEISDYAMANAQPGDLILTLGGGDIYKCADLLVEKYSKQ